jgi:hypothetical protein
MTIYIKMLGNTNNNNANNNNNGNNKTGIMASVYPTTKPTYSSTYENRFAEYKPIGSPGLGGGWMSIQSPTSKHTKSA